MVNPYEKPYNTNDKTQEGACFVEKSRAHSEMTILITAPKGWLPLINPYIPYMAHDVFICPNNLTSALKRVQSQRNLCHIELIPSLDAHTTCEYSYNVPLDLLKTASIAFGGFSNLKQIETNVTLLRIRTNQDKLPKLRILIGAVNRLEKFFTRGVMLYESTIDGYYVSIRVLYASFFLVFIPSMLSICQYIDVPLILATSIGYIKPLLWVPLVYSCFRDTQINSAMLPLLMESLWTVLCQPGKVPSVVSSIAMFAFIPPIATPYLAKIYGYSVLPTAMSLVGNSIRDCYGKLKLQ